MLNFILLFGSQFDILFPTIVNNNVLSSSHQGRRGLDRMVCWICNYFCNQCLSPLKL
jgi:hypothetical protein